MAKEIERKFLVISDTFKSNPDNVTEIAQGYLSTLPEATVRVRIRGGRAFLTVKGRNDGCVRDEWEYEIPVEDAREMLGRCATGGCIIKTRYCVGRWEVDEFHGELEGLTVAEIEMSAPDDRIALPSFVGEEVTGDPRYYNSSLLKGRPGEGGNR